MKIITPAPTWAEILIDEDKDMNGKSLINLNEVIANKVNAFNSKYDSDLNGVIENSAIPNLSRSKITDFFNAPFWNNIPDKEEFYSTTDDLSDLVWHQAEASLKGGEVLTFLNISDEVEFLLGLYATERADDKTRIDYTIDGATTVQKLCTNLSAHISGYYVILLPPLKAHSSLKIDFRDISTTTSSYDHYGIGVTKCPFLDEKKPNVLFDVDSEGKIIGVHKALRVIDTSKYNPLSNGKHVHLIGNYELEKIPKGIPLRFIKYQNGEFVRVKWGYKFRKEVTVLGKEKVILWEKTLEFDWELSEEEIKQIEEQLGVKLVGVI